MEHRPPFATTSPARARILATDFARHRLAPDRADEFLLMVSEVVGNAVRHGEPEADGRIGLLLQADEPAIRAVVVDAAPAFTFDRVNLEEGSPELHLGLMVVDHLADRWGLAIDGKKAVWFEVDRSGG